MHQAGQSAGWGAARDHVCQAPTPATAPQSLTSGSSGLKECHRWGCGSSWQPLRDARSCPFPHRHKNLSTAPGGRGGTHAPQVDAGARSSELLPAPLVWSTHGGHGVCQHPGVLAGRAPSPSTQKGTSNQPCRRLGGHSRQVRATRVSTWCIAWLQGLCRERVGWRHAVRWRG